MTGTVSVSWRGRTCLVAIDRPAVGNALSAAVVEELHAALDEAVAGQAALLVLTGAGRHFCTGFDLTDVELQEDSILLHRFIRIEMLLSRIYAAPFVTLGYVTGSAFGAGADLYAACSRRLSSSLAKFAFPGTGFGILLGTRRLAERVSAPAAQDLVVSGRLIGATEAVQLGLTQELVEPAAFAGRLEQEIASSNRLDLGTLASVRRMLSQADEDRNLADLVRSAIRPGLRDRIINYRSRVKQR